MEYSIFAFKDNMHISYRFTKQKQPDGTLENTMITIISPKDDIHAIWSGCLTNPRLCLFLQKKLTAFVITDDALEVPIEVEKINTEVYPSFKVINLPEEYIKLESLPIKLNFE